MEKDFEGRLVVRAFVLFYPDSLEHGVRHHQMESWPEILDCTSVLVKGMERIVDAMVYGFPARLCAHGAEPGYDEHFCISQGELRGGQVRVRRKSFVGHRLCPQ